jgi:hypothetical protein
LECGCKLNNATCICVTMADLCLFAIYAHQAPAVLSALMGILLFMADHFSFDDQFMTVFVGIIGLSYAIVSIL